MVNAKNRFETMRHKSIRKIEEAAIGLFSKNGYHSTSIGKIAQKAGIATGLMYNYFKSKEDLLKSIIDNYFNQIFLSVSEKIKNSNLDIEKLIDALIETLKDNRKTWKLLISTMFQPDVSKICLNQIGQFFLHQETVFEKYFKEKGIKNPRENSIVLSEMLHGAFLSFAGSGNIDRLNLVRRTIVKDIITNGLKIE